MRKTVEDNLMNAQRSLSYNNMKTLGFSDQEEQKDSNNVKVPAQNTTSRPSTQSRVVEENEDFSISVTG